MRRGAAISIRQRGAGPRGAPVEEDELVAFCAERLARYKCPDKILFVPELPSGLGGKVLRRSLPTS